MRVELTKVSRTQQSSRPLLNVQMHSQTHEKHKHGKLNICFFHYIDLLHKKMTTKVTKHGPTDSMLRKKLAQA